jgi:hypothetical protein
MHQGNAQGRTPVLFGARGRNRCELHPLGPADMLIPSWKIFEGNDFLTLIGAAACGARTGSF